MSRSGRPSNHPFWISPAYNTRSQAQTKGKVSPNYPPKGEKVKFSPSYGLKGLIKGMATGGTPSPQPDEPSQGSSQYAGSSQPSSLPPSSGLGPSMSGALEGKSLSPSLFNGLPSEDAKAWLLYFKRYAQFRKFSDDDLLSVFPLFLRAAATDWFDQLSEDVRASFDQLEASFLARFTSSDFTRWVRVSDLFSRNQKPTETVDEYVVQIQKMAKAVEMTDDNFTRYAILKGLKPQLRCYVLQNNARTVDEVLRLGRIAEQTVSNDSSLLCELQKDQNVAKLEAELKNLASTVQKLAVGNVGGVAAPRPRPSRGRRPPPPLRRQPFQSSQQTSSWSRPPMAHLQDSPRPLPPPTNHGVRLPAPPRLPDRTSPLPGPCLCCGRQHFNFLDCPARNAQCYSCQSLGHFSRMCNRTAQPTQYSA